MNDVAVAAGPGQYNLLQSLLLYSRFVGMFLLGIVATLIAAVLGFARARAFGPSARWFSYSAVCLLLFHIQLLLIGFGAISNDTTFASNVVAFFNFFVVLAAVCAIMGFIQIDEPTLATKWAPSERRANSKLA